MKRFVISFMIFFLFNANVCTFAQEKYFTFIKDINELGIPENTEDIKYKKDDIGGLKHIAYQVTSTGATSGIRYRTAEIKVQIDDYEYTIDSTDFLNFRPEPGQTVVSQIQISKENFLDSLEPILDDEREHISKKMNDVSNIKVGATIEIYNASTGKVLDTIYGKDEVASVMGKYGFADKHIEEAKQQWKGSDKQQSQEESTANKGLRPGFGRDRSIDDPPNTGLRPTIMRSKSIYDD